MKIKKLGLYLLSLVTLGVILGIAILNNKAIETSITIVLFFIYRKLFTKQFHASSLYLCAFISIIVFIVIINIEVNLATSILISVVLTFTITLISYFVRDYLDTRVLVKKYRIKLETFDVKCVNNLTEEEMIKLMPSIPYDVIHIVYGYLHKPNTISASGYAYRNNISEATLYRYVKRVKTKYESLGLIS